MDATDPERRGVVLLALFFSLSPLRLFPLSLLGPRLREREGWGEADGEREVDRRADGDREAEEYGRGRWRGVPGAPSDGDKEVDLE